MTWVPFCAGWAVVCGVWSMGLRGKFEEEPDRYEPLYHAAVWAVFGVTAAIWWAVYEVVR